MTVVVADVGEAILRSPDFRFGFKYVICLFIIPVLMILAGHIALQVFEAAFLSPYFAGFVYIMEDKALIAKGDCC